MVVQAAQTAVVMVGPLTRTKGGTKGGPLTRREANRSRRAQARRGEPQIATTFRARSLSEQRKEPPSAGMAAEAALAVTLAVTLAT